MWHVYGMCVLLYFSLVCLRVCAHAFTKFKVHCGSAFEPGASGLPYYCTPPVCVPDVIGALAVWRQTTTTTIKKVLTRRIPKSIIHFPLPSHGGPHFCKFQDNLVISLIDSG